MIPFAIWLGMLLAARRPQPADFEHEVRPILESHCQPCHFPGGKMYARLPFDRPKTIVKLDTKLFTRIKDERERDVIRRFLGERASRPQ